VQGEESINRDREPAQERPGKAKECMGNMAEREELKKKKTDKEPDRGKGSNQLRKSNGPQGREGEMDK